MPPILIESRNPLFNGSTVASHNSLAHGAEIIVAIPYSTGLLLQVGFRPTKRSLTMITSQSPIQRVYCCKSLSHGPRR